MKQRLQILLKAKNDKIHFSTFSLFLVFFGEFWMALRSLFKAFGNFGKLTHPKVGALEMDDAIDAPERLQCEAEIAH